MLTPAQIKPKSFESRRNFSFFPSSTAPSPPPLFFKPVAHAPHVYVRTWAYVRTLLPQSYQYPNSNDILPSTTAVFSHATGSRKLSANEQFFVGAQTVVSLLQTAQIKQGVSFIAANKVYTSTNKTTIV